MKTPAEIAKAAVAGWVCRLANPPPDLEYLTAAIAAAIQDERDRADAMRDALKPFAKLGKYVRGLSGKIYGIRSPKGEADITFDDLREATVAWIGGRHHNALQQTDDGTLANPTPSGGD